MSGLSVYIQWVRLICRVSSNCDFEKLPLRIVFRRNVFEQFFQRNLRTYVFIINRLIVKKSFSASSLRDESYDFIIVGASPSGAALANRLSENPKWRILLLEAGEEPAFPTEVPMACAPTALSEYSWPYRTEKQEGFCRGRKPILMKQYIVLS